MDRQARTRDTALAKSRELTGRSQTQPWWLGGVGVKTKENKVHWPRYMGMEEAGGQCTVLFK
jgi:hypothetical protein